MGDLTAQDAARLADEYNSNSGIRSWKMVMDEIEKQARVGAKSVVMEMYLIDDGLFKRLENLGYKLEVTHIDDDNFIGSRIPAYWIKWSGVSEARNDTVTIYPVDDDKENIEEGTPFTMQDFVDAFGDEGSELFQKLSKRSD